MESRSPTYNSWQAMKKRCLNKKHKGYKDYGEKGITICDEWIDYYQNFKKDMGEKPEIIHQIEQIIPQVILKKIANGLQLQNRIEIVRIIKLQNIMEIEKF